MNASQSPRGRDATARAQRLADELADAAGLGDVRVELAHPPSDARPLVAGSVRRGASARIYLTPAIPETLDDEQLRAVLAHETGHLVHRHGRTTRIARRLRWASTVATLAAVAALAWAGLADPLEAWLLAAWCVLAPWPLLLVLHRRQEVQAHLHALRSIPRPAALVSAIRVLAGPRRQGWLARLTALLGEQPTPGQAAGLARRWAERRRRAGADKPGRIG